MAITTSILTGGSNSHTTSSEEVNGLATDFIANGIVGTLGNTSGVAPTTGNFSINAQGTPDMTVAVGSGIAYVTGTPTSQNSQTFRIKNSASSNVTISANASGSTKYDWLYISLSATNLNTPNTAGDNVATLVTSRSSSASSDDGTPPTYGLVLAVITVANGASSITNGTIRDARAQAAVNASSSSTSTGWTSLGYNPATVTANGNRSYSLVFNSTDLTGTLSPGMRLRTTRTTVAPTQCTSLNGTNQYYSKSSPSGMTFTDDFTVSGWIKLTSYQAATIVSRYNGTSGWEFGITSTGILFLKGYNAGAANFSNVTSYQSIPLNKWVHVAAQLDMSAFTATSTTSYLMVDGLDIPATVARAGTNPTALVQAGNLEVGSQNGGTVLFPGKIAQVAIYSAKVTQATIRTSISQTLAGTETSQISAYSFNNSINDLNANANNLTANGSAVATNADSPFAVNSFGTPDGSKDFGVITSVTYSTNTTVVIQVAEANTVPTSGGVSAVSYATHKAPYGFPSQRGKWTVEVLYLTSISKTSGISTATWYNPGTQITVPIGEWIAAYEGALAITSGATSGLFAKGTLSTANNSESDARLSVGTPVIGASATQSESMVSRRGNISLSAQTIYYLNFNAINGTSLSLFWFGSDSPVIITLDCAYL